MKAPRTPWTPAEIRVVTKLYATTPTAAIARRLRRGVLSVYNRAWALGLRKDPSVAAAHGRKLANHPRAVAHRFQPGQVPVNKGLRRPGWAPGRMRETQFKPGQVSVRWDPEIYCVGALRINTNGILEIKVAPGPRRWVILARYTWSTERGPIPPAHVVRVKNDDPYDVADINNLELITRAENMRRNTIHNLPKPLKDTINVLGRLKRRIHEEQDRRLA